MKTGYVILKDGSTTEVQYNGDYDDCMKVCKECYGYYPYLDSVQKGSSQKEVRNKTSARFGQT